MNQAAVSDLSTDGIAELPDEVTVTLTRAEMLAVTQGLAAFRFTDKRHADAKSAFVKIIRACRVPTPHP